MDGGHNCWESVFSFLQVEPRNRTQVLLLEDKSLFPSSRLWPLILKARPKGWLGPNFSCWTHPGLSSLTCIYTGPGGQLAKPGVGPAPQQPENPSIQLRSLGWGSAASSHALWLELRTSRTSLPGPISKMGVKIRIPSSVTSQEPMS